MEANYKMVPTRDGFGEGVVELGRKLVEIPLHVDIQPFRLVDAGIIGDLPVFRNVPSYTHLFYGFVFI